MPHYDYECQKCKHVFEVFQSMTDKHLTKCPKCKGPVRRLIGGGSGIIFKGSGFYETDYKKKSGAKPCEKAAPSCPANCKHKH
ncbi:MAG: FmdB family zinc ribbon protein [Candidatus Omnitrophota bacterium]|jgi:putative FmdB family regulatory protein